MPTLDWIGKGAVVKHHKDVRRAGTTIIASATSHSASTITAESAISTARRNLNVPFGWTCKRKKAVWNSGCVIWCARKGARSSCRSRTGVFTPTSSASYLAASIWQSNTKAQISGRLQRMTD